MRTFLKSLPAALLVLLFTYAALSKLADFPAFRGQLYNQAFPHGVADVLAYLLPATELSAVGLLLFPRTFFAGLQLSLSLMLLFTGYIALVLLHFWNRIPCSCGGVLSHMGWETHLVFNIIFTGIAFTGILMHTGTRTKGSAENLRTE
jgi:putative oxidoreductase